MVQRYKFESKSQQVNPAVLNPICCFQWFKDTNLKVNHNFVVIMSYLYLVVSNGSKIQI